MVNKDYQKAEMGTWQDRSVAYFGFLHAEVDQDRKILWSQILRKN